MFVVPVFAFFAQVDTHVEIVQVPRELFVANHSCTRADVDVIQWGSDLINARQSPSST